MAVPSTSPRYDVTDADVLETVERLYERFEHASDDAQAAVLRALHEDLGLSLRDVRSLVGMTSHMARTRYQTLVGPIRGET